MAKNNYLINKLRDAEKAKKEFQRANHNNIPQIYAALVVSMYDLGYCQEEISDILEQTKTTWDRFVLREDRTIQSMVDYCREHTGIDVQLDDPESYDY